MVLAAHKQLLLIFVTILLAMLLMAQEFAELPLAGCLSLLVLLVKSSLKGQLELLLRVFDCSGVHALAERGRQVFLMREEMSYIVALFEAAETHVRLVDLPAVLEAG